MQLPGSTIECVQPPVLLEHGWDKHLQNVAKLQTPTNFIENINNINLHNHNKIFHDMGIKHSHKMTCNPTWTMNFVLHC